MRNYVSYNKGAVGFGSTKEESENEAYLNACKADISNDVRGSFIAYRDILKPWLPMNNMLHISGVGCLVYADGVLTETVSKKSVRVSKPYKSIYYYLAKTFGPKLSYVGITIVCRPEIDAFFKNISPEITLVSETAPLKRLGTYNGFDPKVNYILRNNLVLAKTKDAIGIKQFGDELFIVQEGSSDIESLAYPGYRLGYVITEEGIEDVEEVEEL